MLPRPQQCLKPFSSLLEGAWHIYPDLASSQALRWRDPGPGEAERKPDSWIDGIWEAKLFS